jgi:transcriptional regulator GlxA family with amidase domain
MKQGKVPLSPNRVWLIAPDTPFGTELEAPVTQHFIHFTLAPIYACEPGLYSVEISAAMQSLLDMVQENNPKNKANEYTAENIVIARNAFVLLSLCGLPPGILHESRIDGRILRTIEHMERDISNIHTLDDLAKIAGMNPRALIRLFKQETGVTPMASLRARRIALACDMLHHTNRSIDEIATLTGFYDRYHFSKTFKNLREVTPTSFRHLR